MVDWRSAVPHRFSIAASSALKFFEESLPAAVHLEIPYISWEKFSIHWHESYVNLCSTYQDSSPNFIRADQHLYSSLVQLLDDYQLTGLWNDEELEELCHIWHTLDAWPDSSTGIAQLRQKFSVCALSNGSMEFLGNLKYYADLPWTHLFPTEIFDAYKPSPRVYKCAAERLGLKPRDCALASAHLSDLRAAKGCGYQTIYLERKDEETWEKDNVKEAAFAGWVDMWIGLEQTENGGGILEIANRFKSVMG